MPMVFLLQQALSFSKVKVISEMFIGDESRTLIWCGLRDSQRLERQIFKSIKQYEIFLQKINKSSISMFFY